MYDGSTGQVSFFLIAYPQAVQSLRRNRRGHHPRPHRRGIPRRHRHAYVLSSLRPRRRGLRRLRPGRRPLGPLQLVGPAVVAAMGSQVDRSWAKRSHRRRPKCFGMAEGRGRQWGRSCCMSVGEGQRARLSWKEGPSLWMTYNLGWAGA